MNNFLQTSLYFSFYFLFTQSAITIQITYNFQQDLTCIYNRFIAAITSFFNSIYLIIGNYRGLFAKNTLVNVGNTFLTLKNTLVNVCNTFLTLKNTFAIGKNTFVIVSNTFVILKNTFVNARNISVNTKAIGFNEGFGMFTINFVRFLKPYRISHFGSLDKTQILTSIMFKNFWKCEKLY